MKIYKSAMCKNIQKTGHCPRGKFCAFAHTNSNNEGVFDNFGFHRSLEGLEELELLLERYKNRHREL